MGVQKRYRLWFAAMRGTRGGEPCARERKGADAPPLPTAAATSGRVVHLELDRMRRHAEARDLLHLQLDVGVDHIVGEHTAAREELAVLVDRIERLVEGRA